MRRRSPGSASTWLRCCSSATSCAGWGNIPGGRCSPSAWARCWPSTWCSNSGSRCRCPRARSNASSGWADLDEIQALMHGFGVAMTPTNIALMFTGVILGVIIGVLPGLGGANGVAILLPLTFGMAQTPGGATSAIILLSCIYWGALFGGAITSILFNIPGEPWSVATTFDGHPLAQQGKPGAPLTAAINSVFLELQSGINFIVIAIGLFGLGEIFLTVEEGLRLRGVPGRIGFRDLWETWKMFPRYWATLIRATILGFWIGVLPGTGATPASFMSYGLAKQFSKNPDRFGKGEVEGVIAPET